MEQVDSGELSVLNAAFIKRLKISVAMAIIRNKPSNLSAREYAGNLAKRLRQKETNWKERIQRLEDELLKTKQELVVSRLQDAGLCVQFSDLWTEEGKAESLDSMEIDISQNEASAGADGIHFLTPPCSSEETNPKNRLETTLRSNALFLHGIAQLKSIPECTRTDIDQTVLDTAITAIQHVENYMVENCHGPWNHGKVLEEAIKGIVGLLGMNFIGECVDLLSACERLVGRLLRSLLEHDGLNNNCFQQTLCQLLTMLGRVDKLQIPTLHCILNHLKETSTMLRRTHQGKQDLNHVLFENTFYICIIFEDLIVDQRGCRKSVGTDFKQSRLSENVVMELHEGLQDCLLHISREYPLYAQFIWRLSGALECIQIK